MQRSYQDIVERIIEPPHWFDIRGVPRYVAFIDGLGVYWSGAALFEIGCQGCDKTFRVGVDWTPAELAYCTIRGVEHTAPISVAAYLPDEMIDEQRTGADSVEERAAAFRYGDPPNHGCVGDTMGAPTLRTVELWRRGSWTENRGEPVRLPAANQ